MSAVMGLRGAISTPPSSPGAVGCSSTSTGSTQKESGSNDQGRVRVAVRVRPFSAEEIKAGCKSIISMKGNSQCRVLDPTYFDANSSQPREVWERCFTFDHAFWSHNRSDPAYCSQGVVYDQIGESLVQNAISGYNCSLFAYGQTGSGKTHTIVGYSLEEEGAEGAGVIPRLCKSLFQKVQPGKVADSLGSVFLDAYMTVSFCEVYNESVRDLIADPDDLQGSKSLKVREHPEKGAFVEGLRVEDAKSYKQVMSLLERGMKSRTTAATAMNAVSSRSHAIFTVTIKTTVREASISTSTDSELLSTRSSKICLVDLAGSERLQSSRVEGERLREASNINKSLSTLGEVIKSLAKRSSGGSRGGSGSKGGPAATMLDEASFVPYRNSVLTWLLKDSLGGNSKTVMLATVSPAPESYSETVSTLRYVERAKRIVNLAHVNDGETNPLLLKLKDEVAELRAELHRVQQEHKHKEEVWQKNDSTVASQLLRIQKQVEQQRSRADAAESSAKALAETLAAREREVSLLHQEEASITAKVRKLEGAVTASDAAASQLQNELSQALHRLSESHNTISESKMKREELSEMISSLQAEIKTLRESSAALEEDVTRLQRGKLSSEATSGDLREKMTTLQDQFSSSLRDSATSIERLEAELASAETARIELESSTALRLKEMQVAANGEKDNLTQTIASLQAKASLAEESALSLESHVQQLQNELITSQNMVSRLSEQALEREKVEMAQRDELSNSQAACLELIAKEKRHADELAVALSGLKEAQNRISSSDVTIARLNRDCESLHGAQSDLQQKLSDFEIRESTMLNDLEHRSVQVSSLETQISSLEVSKSSLEEQVAELLRQVEEGCARLSSSEAQASERGNANQQLQQQLRTLEAEKMRVEGELSSSTGRLSDMVKERDELIQTTSLLRQELSSIKMLHSNVEYELSALAAAKRDSESDAAVIHQKMTAQLADLQAAKSASESNFSDLSKLNASLRAEYESSVSLLEKERMRTQEVQMKGQSEAQNLQQRITGLLRDVKDAHENLEERQSELASSRLLAENLQSELTELAAFNAGMQSDSAALHNKLSESASRFELEKADIRKEAENLRDELMCIRSSHSTLEQEIAAAASTAAECALKHNLELSRLNLENDKVSKEMKELQQELSSTRASHATDIAAAASIAVAVEAKHDSQLSEIRNELAKASSDLALSQIRASKAEEDKAGFLAKVKSLEERLSALVDEKQAADSTVQKMRSELASLQMAHSNAEFELSALAAAKLDAESDAVAAREEMMVQMSQLQVNNNELVSQITEVRDSNAKLKRDVEDAEKRCTSLEHDMSGLLLEKEAGDDLIFDLRSKFNALEGDQETSKQELEALRMDFASSSRSLEEELHSRAALEEERCTLINAKCALESRVERLELELTDQQRQHEGLLSTLSQSKKEVIELQANEQQSCRELQLLHGEYQTLEAKLAELKLEYCEALTLNSSLQKNAAESAKILQDANEQLEVDKASLQAANTEMAAAKAALKQELNFCERRVELLERELTEAQEGVCAAAQVIDSLKIEGDAALNQVNEMIQQARAQALVHGEKLSAAVLDKEESLRSEHQELLRSKDVEISALVARQQELETMLETGNCELKDQKSRIASLQKLCSKLESNLSRSVEERMKDLEAKDYRSKNERTLEERMGELEAHAARSAIEAAAAWQIQLERDFEHQTLKRDHEDLKTINEVLRAKLEASNVELSYRSLSAGRRLLMTLGMIGTPKMPVTRKEFFAPEVHTPAPVGDLCA